ncbi:MAG: glycosyltransferase family 39 protein [Thermoflexales bacterium]|nr:glycosyltransferase family 39 protein [Thermoflexales bacterium]
MAEADPLNSVSSLAGSGSGRRAWLPVLGAVAGLGLAGLGESFARGSNSGLTIPLYVAGILIFALTATRRFEFPGLRARNAQKPSDAQPLITTRWVVLIVLFILAALATRQGVQHLMKSINEPEGARFWFLAVGLLVLAGVLLGDLGTHAPRWGEQALPRHPGARRLVAYALLAVLVLAIGARVLWLDRIPLGINPDEGDRAGTAILLANGTLKSGIFDSGWYFISNMYFSMMAVFLRAFGYGFAQARLFTALFGIAATLVVGWIGIRNFGWRVGLAAAALYAALGVALQFARETSEAGQTAALWAISMALFLEAARRGRILAWIGAGAVGAYSIYFYPTGRLWAVLAAAWCLYLLIRQRGVRLAVLRGAALAAITALIVVAPFFVNVAARPQEFTLRAQQTTIFEPENLGRLPYYDKTWSTPRLLVEQTVRTFGIFSKYDDRNGFWPTDQPLMPGLPAVLLLVGVGLCALAFRDPRAVALLLWFGVGISGSIVTVETPNLQRITTAIPTLSLFMALTVTEVARRVRQALPLPALRVATPLVAALTVLAIMASQLNFYFNVYGPTRRYEAGTWQGLAVAAQGSDTLTMTVGRYHFFNQSGWVRLLAPEVPRASLRSPGSNLPLPLAPARSQAFVLYFGQPFYPPYLEEILPGGHFEPIGVDPVLGVYRIPAQQLARLQGALVTLPDGSVAAVPTFGALPAGWAGGTGTLVWRAGMRAPQFGNYSFHVGQGPAEIAIGGQTVLRVPDGAAMTTTVTLARGDHAVSITATVPATGTPAIAMRYEGPGNPTEWAPVPTERLFSRQTRTAGLSGIAQVGGKPGQQRIDGALASCCMGEQVQNLGQPFGMTWAGSIDLPATGVYTFGLGVEGEATLWINHQALLTSRTPDVQTLITATLSAGRYPVTVTMQGAGGGVIEWTWAPPGRPLSIVPPSALTPATNGVTYPALPIEQLRGIGGYAENPVEYAR